MREDPLRLQYERFPYPPISSLALPLKGQGRALRFEAEARSHRGIRILVAGAGTLEAVVVAQSHPHAREVVAVDFSQASVALLKRRLGLARARSLLLRPLGHGRLPPVKAVHADLLSWEGGRFDYILASNVLHHAPDPAALLARLASWLEPGGLMRIVTYPKASRIWMRETSAWLKLHGLTVGGDPGLRKRAIEAVLALPEAHPIRSCFLSHPETRRLGGLVDAFLNARERPLAPLEWRDAVERAGLELVSEGQTETSRSDFLPALAPGTTLLDRWERLQILDDLLEICANPVLWLRRGRGSPAVAPSADLASESPSPVPGPAPLGAPSGGILATRAGSPERLSGRDLRAREIWLPSRPRWELGSGLRRAQRLLSRCDVSLEALLAALREHVGPRVTADGERILPGLSILDYPLEELLAAPRPWESSDWERLESASACLPESAPPGMSRSAPPLTLAGAPVPGPSWAAQAQWLQCRYGPSKSWIGPIRVGSPASR